MNLAYFVATVRHAFNRRIGKTMVPIAALAVLAAPASAFELSADATLYDRAGNQVGKARLTQHGGDHVNVHVRAHDLPPGFHGFHVHAVGQCNPPFTSAGGHFDLGGHVHRDHSGDLPVLQVKADGTAHARLDTDRFSLADLFDADGSAIIIHANADNYANIPNRYAPAPDATTLATGDAGDRIACGVIQKVIQR